MLQADRGAGALLGVHKLVVVEHIGQGLLECEGGCINVHDIRAWSVRSTGTGVGFCDARLWRVGKPRWNHYGATNFLWSSVS